MSITMVGHSTVLIVTGGLRILTDPYFGTRGNPAYARLRPPAMTREEVGPVDVVLLSHNTGTIRTAGYLAAWGETSRSWLRSGPRG
ncbi:MAG: MBL fold metallo-hydrolase [Longimicrobiales bacterium]|nr:MBL fold metallo-hydrolase [Longimicrobiales bacterium]